MPIFLKKRRIQRILITFLVIMMILSIICVFYNWWLAIIHILVIISFYYLLIKADAVFQSEAEKYISLLSYRVKKVGEEALLQMPIGILLINDDYIIEWANPYMASCLNEDSLIGRSLYDVADVLIPVIKQEIENEKVTLNDHQYQMIYKKEEKLLYFFDITEQALIEKKYKDEKPVISIVYLDNYDEITQAMDDRERGNLNSRVTSLLNEWANHFGIYLKRVNSDRYIAFFNEKILHELEKDKFSILDKVSESIVRNNIPLTLSIGVGVGLSSLPDIGASHNQV